MTMPTMSKGRWIGLAVATLLAVLLIAEAFSPGLYWSGGVSGELRVTVTDRATGRPIPGATVAYHYSDADVKLVMDPARLGEPIRQELTDAAGRCRMKVDFDAGGTMSFFGRHGTFATDNELSVEVPGYRSYNAALADLLGGRVHRIGSKTKSEVGVQLDAVPPASAQD